MHDTSLVSTNPILTNVQPLQALPTTVPFISPAGLNRYIIKTEDIKLQATPKYNASVEDNAYKECIEKM